MFHKLKILTKMQLSEKIKINRTGNHNQTLAPIGRMIVTMAISYGIFVALFYLIFNVIFFKASVNLFIFVIAVMQLISIFTCTVSLSDSLYISKDNMLLLTYPVKHILVYISKLAVAYVMEFIKSLLFTFPIFMAYATIVKGVINVNYILSSIIYSVILPLFPVLIGAILSIPLVYITKLIKKFSIAKILATLLLVAALIFITYKIVDILPDQLRIVALYNSFLTKCTDFFGVVDKYTLYVTFIGRAIYGVSPFLNNLFALLCLIGIAAIAVLTSLPLFFKLASAQAEHSIQKVHKARNHVSKSPFLTFLRKEILLSIRNMADFANNYLFLFIMPFVLIIMASIYIRIDRNTLGVAMTYGFIGLISLIMLAASNTASATAISSEGNEFVLLKTSPSDTKAILYSKMLVNFIISFIASFITFIILSIVLKGYVEIINLWVVFGVINIVNLGLIFWSIQLDVLNPNLREYANSQNRSEVKNFSTSITIGCIVAVIFSALMIVMFITNLGIKNISLILLLAATLFTGIRLYFLINYVNAYFDDIQL